MVKSLMKTTTPIKFHSTAAFVKDIEKSKHFYVEILKQEIELDFGKNVILKSGITLWEIQTDHIIPLQLGVDSVANDDHQRFEFYFETENIDQIYNDLHVSGVEFLHTLHEEPWGQKTIRFFDPDRHLIEIGESMPIFVGRLYNDGLTPRQIAEKTSIPYQEIKKLLP